MAALDDVDVWLTRLHRFWSTHVDALERLLDRMGRSDNGPNASADRRSNGGPPEKHRGEDR